MILPSTHVRPPHSPRSLHLLIDNGALLEATGDLARAISSVRGSPSVKPSNYRPEEERHGPVDFRTAFLACNFAISWEVFELARRRDLSIARSPWVGRGRGRPFFGRKDRVVAGMVPNTARIKN